MSKVAQNLQLRVRVIVIALAGLLLVLQGRLWLSDEGWSEVVRLRSGVADQQAENERMAERNARLQAEVSDLKDGFAALEERARADLGMVGEDESFYLFIPEASDVEADE
ncbi:MAG: cell division protein FtsB [Chromatiales bacterium]|jgi:cell division protein FtsB|nr:cell division protein FtsB [Chromatiales bacterium]MDP6149633.1 cell division protein FtsB [Gammaproteobacteria bacterium]MDP7093689.1 cell division protein FtsB [Gammaproteobacteria bacterium]MDP7271246.1 cell division protein FtsB [Gammaproteobacteria bacterium]HJP03703.1 cell division protein FtsB [Gammaproteobacteria bacterium]